MSEHRFTIRLDDRYESERQAWHNLNLIQHRTHQSYSKIIADAVNNADREQIHLSPADEDRLAARITESVAAKLQQMLPVYLAGYAAGAATSPTTDDEGRGVSKAPPLPEEENQENEMPDFSGSVMDWEFIG